jgi:hypothetical protein
MVIPPQYLVEKSLLSVVAQKVFDFFIYVKKNSILLLITNLKTTYLCHK